MGTRAFVGAHEIHERPCREPVRENVVLLQQHHPTPALDPAVAIVERVDVGLN